MQAPAAPRRDEPGDNHFNFLRLTLAAAVLLSHAPAFTDRDSAREPLYRIFHNLALGELAVAGFFLLSGFLIVQSWQRHPELRTFLRNRALRIYPGYLAAALISVLIVGPLGAADAGRYLGQIAPWNLLQDLALLQMPTTPATFPGQLHPQVNGSLWTISYECGCYLFAALLGVCGVFKYRRVFFGLTVTVAGTWLLPQFARELVTFSLANFGRGCTDALYAFLLGCNAHKLFVNFLLFFCAGGCFGLFRDRIRFSKPWALAGAAVVFPCMFSRVGSEVALVTLGAYAFFTLAFARLPALDLFKGHTDISYGVYLYGWPAEQLIHRWLPAVSPWVVFALAAAASGAAGWASWRFVERPFLRLKRRRVSAEAGRTADPLRDDDAGAVGGTGAAGSVGRSFGSLHSLRVTEESARMPP